MQRRRWLLMGVVAPWALAAATERSANSELKAELDRPFAFLLSLPGWKVGESAHDSDLFSTWGHFVLRLAPTQPATPTATQGLVRRRALAADWSKTPEELAPDMDEPAAASLPISGTVMNFRLRLGAQGHSSGTRYALRIWLSSDGRALWVRYRVDGG